MNYKFLLFLLLPLCFANCDDDDDSQSVDDIRIRVTNITLCDLEDIQLGFSGLADARSYGSLVQGDTSDYLSFAAAGTCSIDFSATSCGTINGLQFQSVCECICSLSPGNYMARIINTGGIPIETVTIIEE
jgi:hypothetical protein